MICVNANILAAMDVLPIREKRAAPRKGIDFSCVDTKFKCEGVSCTVCADVDITPSTGGTGDKFHNCLPNFPF
ncbi:hypothetical protein OESDEN_23120 [Oesophagostomum dentatum]|uniref:Uncharacterized protein n=1 Tax=Oesophagostomum dentatum TaxID=61180 RepID=A0A0B1S224_OESDE|nr:hypothetical protein OESDEN_23120 [Oesophagostomum dentatum]